MEGKGSWEKIPAIHIQHYQRVILNSQHINLEKVILLLKIRKGHTLNMFRKCGSVPKHISRSLLCIIFIFLLKEAPTHQYHKPQQLRIDYRTFIWKQPSVHMCKQKPIVIFLSRICSLIPSLPTDRMETFFFFPDRRKAGFVSATSSSVFLCWGFEGLCSQEALSWGSHLLRIGSRCFRHFMVQ